MTWPFRDVATHDMSVGHSDALEPGVHGRTHEPFAARVGPKTVSEGTLAQKLSA